MTDLAAFLKLDDRHRADPLNRELQEEWELAACKDGVPLLRARIVELEAAVEPVRDYATTLRGMSVEKLAERLDRPDLLKLVRHDCDDAVDLAMERDSLRATLAAVEQERRAALQDAAIFRDGCEQAEQRIEEAASREAALAEKIPVLTSVPRLGIYTKPDISDRARSLLAAAKKWEALAAQDAEVSTDLRAWFEERKQTWFSLKREAETAAKERDAAARDAEKLRAALHRARESFHRIAHGDKSVRSFAEQERAAIYDALELGDDPTMDESDAR